MAKIQANSSGTRSIEVNEQHLQTIEDYQFFRDLIDSNGYVDEDVLNKLKLNIRSMLESETGKDKRLLDLCLDVIYHPNMKAYGLQQLVTLYINWTHLEQKARSARNAVNYAKENADIKFDRSDLDWKAEKERKSKENDLKNKIIDYKLDMKQLREEFNELKASLVKRKVELSADGESD
jgi:hypothetical protein